MPAMERAVLSEVFEKLEGVKKAADAGYEVPEELRVSMYLGTPGEGMVINQVETCRLGDTLLEVSSRESGTLFFIAYEDLRAVSCRVPKSTAGRRTGFA